MTISSTNLYAVGDSNEIFNIFSFFRILFESFFKFGMTIRCTSIGKKKKYVEKISSSIIKSYLQTSSTFTPNVESTTSLYFIRKVCSSYQAVFTWSLSFAKAPENIKISTRGKFLVSSTPYPVYYRTIIVS